MRIHKEGKPIILSVVAAWALILAVAFIYAPLWLMCIASAAALINVAFTVWFFRFPKGPSLTDPSAVFSPADGEIVVIEEVEETEYFKDRRMQVSVFMSLWNVHINWFPVGGEIVYFRHHNGRFMVAWHPKSSERNERTTTVVDMDGGQVMFRQIAGFVARRIVSYAKVGCHVGQNWQAGFIRFGSRVDVFLPLDAKVKVQLGQKVTGSQTILAEFDHKQN